MNFFCCEFQHESDQFQLGEPVDQKLYSLTPPIRNTDYKNKQKLEFQAKQFKTLYSKQQKTYLKNSNYAYLVSAKWFQRWKVYVGYINNNQYVGQGILPPLNQDLIELNRALIVFQEPYSCWNFKLRKTGKNKDQILCMSEKCWQYLKKYTKKNVAIKRQIRTINNNQKIIDLQYLMCKFIIISQSELLRNLRPQYKIQDGYIQFSKYESANIVFSQIIKGLRNKRPQYKNISMEKVKFWKLQHSTSNQKYLAIIKNTQLKFKKNNWKFFFPGEKIIIQNQIIQKIDINSSSVIYIQILEERSSWFFYNKQNNLCDYCDSCQIKKQLVFYCICQTKFYCSSVCKTKHKVKHQSECPDKSIIQEQQKQQNSIQNYNQHSKKGLSGLKNLGNTCYMNAGIQCLSTYKIFINFFLNNQYRRYINKQNNMGTKGKLTTQFAILLKKMYFGQTKVLSPFDFKIQMGKYNQNFSQSNQQDAGQFLSYLLDGLNQDLNQVIKKPYIQTSDYNSTRNDKEVAMQYWNNFIKRNKSKISQLFYGQYKSRVDCTKCNYYSISFDPFLILSLPLPTQQLGKVKVRVIKSLQQIKQEFEVTFFRRKNIKFGYVKQKIRDICNIKNKSLISYYADQNHYILIDQNENLEIIVDKYITSQKNLYCRILEQQEQISVNSVYLGLSHTLKGSFTKGKNLTDTILLSMNKNIKTNQIYTIIKKYYRKLIVDQDSFNLNIKSNATFVIQDCYFCKSSRCDNCPIIYNKSLTELLGMIKQKTFKLQIQMRWLKNQQNILKIISKCIYFQQKINQITIQNCFQILQTTDFLGEQNLWHCKNCKQQVKASKKLEIYKSPKCLIILLKRFRDQGGSFIRTKIFKNIEFPTKLDITKHIVQKRKNEQIIYELKAICNHYGNLSGGHYTAYGKNWHDNEWYEFDDGGVRKINIETCNKSNAYLLFYERQ